MFQFFRNILGITDGRPPDNFVDRPTDQPTGNEFRNPIWNLDDSDEDDDFRAGASTPYGFQVFSDPIEIHRFFEHQMEEMMKTFQTQMFESPTHFGTSTDDFPALRTTEDLPETGSENQGSLRKHYLKPGYDTSKSQLPFGYSSKNPDKDLDDRYQKSGLESILRDGALSDAGPPKEPSRGLQLKTFGRSVVTKTVRRPDGSVERQEIVRDNQGTEKTTTTRQIGDQLYTVITELDPNGVQKRTENYVNIEKEKITDFQKKWDPTIGHDEGEMDQTWKKSFPFYKFF